MGDQKARIPKEAGHLLLRALGGLPVLQAAKIRRARRARGATRDPKVRIQSAQESRIGIFSSIPKVKKTGRNQRPRVPISSCTIEGECHIKSFQIPTAVFLSHI